MATIVLGVASSHGPSLSTPADRFWTAAMRDRGETLIGPDGEVRTYEECEASPPVDIEDQLAPPRMQERVDICARGAEKVEGLFAEARPDVVVVIGNDHENMLFDDSCRPPFAIFTADTAVAYPAAFPPVPPSEEEWLRIMWLRHFGTDGETMACRQDLALHVLRSLIDEEFDVAHVAEQSEGRSIGEAFLYPFHRYFQPAGMPAVVPIVFNTFEPEQPNQPLPKRCYAFGKALRRAIDAWESPARVAVLASGGLSHFLVDEELDHMTLDALKEGTAAAVDALPVHRLRGGNAEARNWIAVAGAMEGAAFEVLEYVPLRRSPAGTGAAVAFARWSSS